MFKSLIVFLLISSSAFAQHFDLKTVVLTPAQIKNIIGPYPKEGTAAHEEDFKILFHYQNTRTAKDCELAKQDEELSVKRMFGDILSEDEVKIMTIFLLKAYASSGINAIVAKKTFNRPRPYVANKNIKPCIDLEKSAAYPSGHTMTTRLFARILSVVYPERAEKFITRAAYYAENRVIGGVHHPSDIKAGNILADHLAKEMINTDDFVNELASLAL